MNVGKLKIPDEIQILMDREIWPKSINNMGMKALNCSREIVRKVAPEMSEIYLQSPPFLTVQDILNQEDNFWLMEGDFLEGDSWLMPYLENSVDLSLLICIGDFGVGSDTFIALNYSKNIDCPSVVRLEWYENNQKARWVKMSNSFSEFCNMLEINL